MVPGRSARFRFADGRSRHPFDFRRTFRHGGGARESAGEMKYSWSLAPTQPLLAGRLASSLGISPLLAQCLLNRGLSEVPLIENFLAPRLKHLADPFLLPDMDKAVDRFFRAREQNE